MSASESRAWLVKAGEDLAFARISIPTRYPSGIPGVAATDMPSRQDATQAIESAAGILQFVEQQMRS